MKRYAIKVKGVLSPMWQSSFEGFQFAQVTGDGGVPHTVLTGDVVDQSALHGCLARIRDLGLELEEVRQIDAE